MHGDCHMVPVNNIITARVYNIPVTGIVGWYGALQLLHAHAVLRRRLP